ncbi:hypothetical protein Ahy_A01g002580 isoform D [Arachis hypogaea]|uniref:Uncharacterized protein n=1 Tax=Arachis hypogaea TaxID=3818 RepID=A0A445EQY5_ARAHY|nr:hypothetical protein Ahy_A01g002580 isoform D [Arachis hypogaea]
MLRVSIGLWVVQVKTRVFQRLREMLSVRGTTYTTAAARSGILPSSVRLSSFPRAPSLQPQFAFTDHICFLEFGVRRLYLLSRASAAVGCPVVFVHVLRRSSLVGVHRSRSSGSHVALLQTLRPTRALHLAVELLSFVAAIPNNRRKMTRQGAYKESDDMLIDEPKLPQQGQSQPFLMNKLFPHADLYRWMSYGNDGKHPACDSSYLGRRKFSYTLDNDIFVRYNTFNSAAELENSIKDKCPLKIDIGPIYNLNIRYESLFLLILS